MRFFKRPFPFEHIKKYKCGCPFLGVTSIVQKVLEEFLQHSYALKGSETEHVLEDSETLVQT